jgi:hypothetical protein
MQSDPVQMQHMVLAMMPLFAAMSIVGAAIVIIPFWVIFKKAGMSPFLSLLMLLGPLGIIMLYVLAFSQWKVVPAPDFGAGYPPPGYPPAPAYPPPGYVPASTSYPAAPQSPAYVPPPDPPATI